MLPLRSMQALANQESRRCHRRSPYDKSRGRHNGLHIGGEFTKAGKGIRTLDIQLGKLTLYQLSYARITVDSLSIQPDASLHTPGRSHQVSARPRDTRPDPM